MISIVFGHMGWNHVNRIVFLYHVPLFFILSGYVLKPADDLQTYARRKFHHLMEPYFVTCLAILVIRTGCDFLFLGIRSIPGLLNTLFLYIILGFAASGTNTTVLGIETNGRIGAIWFLPAMYFALLISQVILRNPSWKTRFFWGGVCYVLSSICAKQVWLPYSLLCAFYAVIYILIGVWLKESDVMSRLRGPHYLLFAAFSVFAWYYRYSMVVVVNAGAADLIVSGIISVCAVLLILRGSGLLKHNSVLEWIGRNSLILMCVHLFEMETMQIIWERIGLINHPYLLYPVRFAFVPAAGALAVMLVQKRDRAITKTDLQPHDEPRKGLAWLVFFIAFVLCRLQLETPMYNMLNSISLLGPFFLLGMVLHQRMHRSFRYDTAFALTLGIAVGTRLLFEKKLVPLPVSIAGYAPLLMTAGMWLEENDASEWIRKCPWIYFITAAVFLYYCYSGMIPQYPKRGFSMIMLGGLCGFLLVLQLSLKASQTTLRFIRRFLGMIQKYFWAMYLMEAVFGNPLRSFLSKQFSLFPDGAVLFISCLCIEVVIGIPAGFAAEKILRLFKKAA